MNSMHGYFIVLLLLISIIPSGCIDPNSDLPQPQTLSDTQKEAFSAVDPDVFLRNPDEYTDRYILIRGMFPGYPTRVE